MLLDHRIFVPFLKGQSTEEQLQKWLSLTYKMQIIGCYAQTKLGHNVQGLGTTAMFYPKIDEFAIHSPTTNLKQSVQIEWTRLIIEEKF
ncbi:putative peroxisomal acyl-coenzyme A oxidase 1.2 isoform X2 [Cucumis sativus]|uniref:putative peroxisomal acyl-coenzyme A oxidase 1.2 isoform X2 n=1 Tax=Cucumis sativus TaxID=3659 RepID=UPI0012F4E93C|nr:putative peroxisomal acyl-coenzyme A oxidase 1.2 isoform X2 [Cucumis sativus]KAE8650592.1 hypothetical protein Csa_011150 [Cucumis sativus]